MSSAASPELGTGVVSTVAATLATCAGIDDAMHRANAAVAARILVFLTVLSSLMNAVPLGNTWSTMRVWSNPIESRRDQQRDCMSILSDQRAASTPGARRANTIHGTVVIVLIGRGHDQRAALTVFPPAIAFASRMASALHSAGAAPPAFREVR
jgi:hypothetical protein